MSVSALHSAAGSMSAEKKGDEYRAGARQRNAAEGKTDSERGRKMQHRMENKWRPNEREGTDTAHGWRKQVQQ